MAAFLDVMAIGGRLQINVQYLQLMGECEGRAWVRIDQGDMSALYTVEHSQAAVLEALARAAVGHGIFAPRPAAAPEGILHYYSPGAKTTGCGADPTTVMSTAQEANVTCAECRARGANPFFGL